VLKDAGRLMLANHFAAGWLRVFNTLARRQLRTLTEVRAMLVSADLTPSRCVRVFDLGPLPLVRAVIAQPRPLTVSSRLSVTA
jgi:hypothetical protein